MKLVVDAHPYDVTESIGGAALGDLFVLKLETKKHGIPVTVKSIQDFFTGLSTRVKDEGFNPVELLGDEQFIIHLVALVWLAKRTAGEKVTFEEASRTSFTNINFDLGENEEDGDAEDPKAPTASTPADVAPAPASTT